MIINVEVGELAVRTDSGRVNLVHHSVSAHTKLATEWRKWAAQLRAEAGASQRTPDVKKRARADQLEFCAEALEENMTNVMLSLSPLAAHNLSLVLPDFSQEAAGQTIGNAIATMTGQHRHSGHSVAECLESSTEGRRAQKRRKAQPGDQDGCGTCEADIQYFGKLLANGPLPSRPAEWCDRGGNTYCDLGGQRWIDQDGVMQKYPHRKHSPNSSFKLPHGARRAR